MTALQILALLFCQGVYVAAQRDDRFVCICRCCYLGECEPVLTFPVENHTDCEKSDCLERLDPIVERARKDAIRVLGAGLNSTVACLLDSTNVQSNSTKLSATEICVVINLLERETCIGHDKCKSTTTIQAFYVNNHWVFGKLAVFSFMFGVFSILGVKGLCVIGPLIRSLLKRFER